MTLFRTEVIEHRSNRAHGEVTLHQPVSFIVFTLVFCAVTALAGIFLATGSFARKVSVVGWVAPAGGAVQVHALKGGLVKDVAVRPGQFVEANAPLASFSLDATGLEGGLADRTRAELAARLRETDIQLSQADLGRDLEVQRLNQRMGALRSEAEQLTDQRQLQIRQREIIQNQVARATALQAQGYLSLTELDQRRQALLSQEQIIADSKRQADAKVAEAADLQLQIRTLTAQAATQASQLRSAKASLGQSLTELDVQTSDLLRAPVAGQIAYVNLRPGETVAPARPLFAISPRGDNLQAELLVPSKAAGFLARGQTVRLMIDAFPFEHFGALKGQIADIGRAPLNPGEIAAPLEQKEAAYRVVVRLQHAAVKAYAGNQQLVSGMTLKADVITERRTFFQWLFEPLLAARDRVAG